MSFTPDGIQILLAPEISWSESVYVEFLESGDTCPLACFNAYRLCKVRGLPIWNQLHASACGNIPQILLLGPENVNISMAFLFIWLPLMVTNELTSMITYSERENLFVDLNGERKKDKILKMFGEEIFSLQSEKISEDFKNDSMNMIYFEKLVELEKRELAAQLALEKKELTAQLALEKRIIVAQLALEKREIVAQLALEKREIAAQLALEKRELVASEKKQEILSRLEGVLSSTQFAYIQEILPVNFLDLFTELSRAQY